MNILYVTTVSGTMNAFLIPHIKMLAEEGHKVDVAFKVNKDPDPQLISLINNIYQFDFNRMPIKNNFLKLIKKMERLIKKNEYDIVHTHTPIASAVVRLACRNLSNVEVIYTAHGFHFYKGAPFINWITYYPVEKWLSKYTDTIITINKEDYTSAKKFHSNKVEYVPGVGIDLKEYSRANKDTSIITKTNLNIKENETILLSIGELNNNKNHKVVLRAIAEINDKSIHYLIAGQGPLESNLVKLSKELGIDKQVHLLGYRKDIPDLLDIADIFIFPSIREGLSVSLMEAMTSALPAVVTNIRGNSDLIDNNLGGYLFKPNDSSELAMQIVNLISDSKTQKQMGEYNKEKIQNYSINKVLKKIKSIYEI